MNTALPPSTGWKEKLAPDEEVRYAAYAARIREIQAQRSARWGQGRALHRKQVAAVHGTLSVLDGLPGFAQYGLFEQPRDYEVWIRLSNGSLDQAPDRIPDVRGMAIRVLGVEGTSALDGGPVTCQDFTLINHEAFTFPNSAGFVDLLTAVSAGNKALVRHVFSRYGVLQAPLQLARVMRVGAKPFSGFATEPLFSALPMANGPYAVRVRLLPSHANGSAARGAEEDLASDFVQRLKERPLHWDLQLQYFSSEEHTPIEDASVNWPTPYTTVARLMLPRQDTASEEGQALAARVEASSFDPWHALAEHRPLGDVQRARKVVYFASQRGRAAL